MAPVISLLAFYATFRLLKVAYYATERELELIFVPKPGCEGAYEVDGRIFAKVHEVTVNSKLFQTETYPLNASDVGESFRHGGQDFTGSVVVWLEDVDPSNIPSAGGIKEVVFGEEKEYRFQCGSRT